MAAGKRNILIEKKAGFKKVEQFLAGKPTYGKFSTPEQIVQDITDGVLTPVDITGATVTAKSYDKVGGKVLVTFTASVVDGPAGKYQFLLTPAQTSGLTWSTGVYDVLITFVSGDAVRTIEGQVRAE